MTETAHEICFDCDRRIRKTPMVSKDWATMDGSRKCETTGKAHRTETAAIRAERAAEKG